MKGGIFLLILIILSSLTLADTDEFFITGIVRNATNNNLTDAIKDIYINISNTTSGKLVYEQTEASVHIDDGVYHVVFDAITNHEWFLHPISFVIKIGSAVFSKQEVMPVPIAHAAFVANDSKFLGGLSSSSYFDSTTYPNLDTDSTDDATIQQVNDSLGNHSQWLDTYPNVDTDSTDDYATANFNTDYYGITSRYDDSNLTADYPNLDTDSTDDLTTATSWGGNLTGTGTSPTLAPCGDGEIWEYELATTSWVCGSDDTTASESNPFTDVDNIYIWNNTGTITLNESKLNKTIDLRDDDTITTNCSGNDCDIGWGNLTSVPSDIADGDADTHLSDQDILDLGYNHTVDVKQWVNDNDADTTYTADEGNITLTGSVFHLLKVDLSKLDNSVSLFITNAVSTLTNYYLKTEIDNSFSGLPNLTMQHINDSQSNWSQYLETYPNLDTDSTDDLDLTTLDNATIIRSHNTSWKVDNATWADNASGVDCSQIAGGTDTDFCSDSTGGAVEWDKIQNWTATTSGCAGGLIASGRFQNGTWNCTTDQTSTANLIDLDIFNMTMAKNTNTSVKAELRNNIDTNYTLLNTRDNAINTSANINALFTDDLTTDDDTIYTADEGNVTLVGSVFHLLKLNLAQFDNSVSAFITTSALTTYQLITGAYTRVNFTADYSTMGAYTDSNLTTKYPNLDTDSTDDLDLTKLDNTSIIRSWNTSWITDNDDDTITTNCSIDGSCSLITYDTELAYINNCSGRDCDIGWGNLTSVPTDIADGDADTTYTADEGNVTLVGSVFHLLKLNLAQFDNSLSWITNSVSDLTNYFTKTQTDTYYWNETTDIDDDEITEAKIAFSTACSAGDYYRLTGNDLECTNPTSGFMKNGTLSNNISTSLNVTFNGLSIDKINSTHWKIWG